MRSLSSYLYVAIIVAAQSVALAQQAPTFGVATDIKAIRRSRELLSGDFNGDGLTDIATVSDAGIGVAFQQVDSTGFRVSMNPTPLPAGQVQSANLNGDKYSDLVLLTNNPQELHVYTGRGNGGFVEKWTKPIAGKDYQFMVADANGDGKKDILLYSKKDPGIVIFLGTGNGTFRPPQTILDDVAFTKVLVTDVNDDRLNDIVGINWISNEVDVFLAYGKMKYGNPSVISFEKEPTVLGVGRIGTSGMTDLVVGFEREAALQVYIGNGFGGFSLNQTLQLDGYPAQLEVRDLNSDAMDDLAVLSAHEGSVDIWMNNEHGMFENHADFAVGTAPIEMTLFAGRKTGAVNAAILDSAASRIRILYSAAERLPAGRETAYGTGVAPRGITSADVNHDGHPDLILANSVSQTYSVFLNDGSGGMGGQIVYPVAMNPTRVYYYPMPDSASLILLAGRYEDKALGNIVNFMTGARTSFSISTQPDPGILGRVKGTRPGYYDLYVEEFERAAQKSYLTKFEQVGPKRYTERNITPAQQFLSAAIGDGTNGHESLFLMTYDSRGQKALAFRTDAADPRRANPVSIFSLPAPVKPNVLLWAGDINNDGIQDLIINFREPDNQLLVSLGSNDSSFAAPQQVLSDEISINDRVALQPVDVNGDGITDILLANEIDKSIQFYPGKGDGRFAPKVRLMSSVGIGGFTAVDLDGDGYPELVVLDTNEGKMRIIRLNP